ncbi:ABC transporter permease [Mesorhizobium sp. M4B.F.Ca.ET.190.01.1.1]|nr:ABC transporter permease [Mesorhizobium sp. M4B.F.Ca.ET.200.01.1.1]TGS19622.1 ABC transporter permease [Mesorhizobium sp. M4B.F.Ca.ET.190.01.1.1]TGT32412.1 ABC transporter permease [Mesorhizobium sp. M4B.F.Ca.ET.172.01.1.1]
MTSSSGSRPTYFSIWPKLRVAYTLAVISFLILPISVIIPMSFNGSGYMAFPPTSWSTRWYSDLLNRPEYVNAFFNSLRIAIPTALIAGIAGTLAAVGAVRGLKQLRIPLSAAALGPLALPQIIFAIGIFPLMARIGLAGSYTAVIIGHVVVCIPLVFVTVVASLRAYSPNLELAAMTLGASWLRCFYSVTLPMIRPGLIAGMVLTFAFSMDELIITLFLASPVTRTLPIVLWESLLYYVSPVVAAAATIVLILSSLLLFVPALLTKTTNNHQ